MKNAPIALKLLGILGLFGLFTLAVSALTAKQIMSVDTNYSNLISDDTASAIAVSRAGRALQNARAAIGDLLMASTDAQNAAAKAELDDARASFIKQMEAAKQGLPTRPELQTLHAAGLQVIDQVCGKAVSDALKSTDAVSIAASQAAFFTDCQPAFTKLTPQFTNAVTTIIDTVNKKSDDLTSVSQSTSTVTVVTVILGLLVVLGLGFVAIRAWIVNPIRGLADKMGSLANGNYDAEVTEADRRDEIGTMGKAVLVFKTNGLKAIQLEKDAEASRSESEREQMKTAENDRRRSGEMAQATTDLARGLKALSAGDLTVNLAQAFAPDFEALRNDFNATVVQLRDTMNQVAQATSSIDDGSRELSGSANDLSKRTEQQAAALEETAAALDQITANVSNAAKRTEEARTVAASADKSARHSGQVVANAVDAMQRIEQSSGQISNIIGVIDEIAFQTNLLALNAGVEAARAGEAGKGFAVVAQEVRELAQRSAQAAKEIKALIQTSAGEVESGVRLVSATGEALQEIGGYVASINQQLDAIAISAKEQSTGLAEVNTAVNQMDQVTQQNAAMVEEATAASATLANEAETLRHLVGRFTVGRQEGGTRRHAA